MKGICPTKFRVEIRGIVRFQRIVNLIREDHRFFGKVLQRDPGFLRKGIRQYVEITALYPVSSRAVV